MAESSKVIEQRSTVSIIGPGRVGQALATALQAAGYSLDALVVKEAVQIEACQSRFPHAMVLDSKQLQNLPASDLILITTPDDVIGETATSVSALHKSTAPQVVLQTSGALSSAVLLPLRRVGYSVGSMHPLVSVGYPPEGAAALHGASFCLEGDEAALVVAEKLVRDFAGESFHIKTESKALYHAAAVIASPHLVALFDLVLELMSQTGMDNEVARKVLLRLVDSTFNNLSTRDDKGAYRNTERALTGTFARGDVGTVKLHLEALINASPNEALEIYKLLGLRSLQLAEKNGLDSKRVDQIKKLFAE